jgi:NAD-dependent dihydropyrimidine dehydrogenase PreA subunit
MDLLESTGYDKSIQNKGLKVMDGTFPLFDPKNCDGCGICAENCPTNSIIIIKEEERIVFKKDNEECLYCGECEASCPKDAIRCSIQIIVR